MYQQFNEQFAAATRQLADTAGQVNRLALESAETVFGLQLAAINERVNANFAFWGEAVEVRDADGLKTLLPKAAQVARENLESVVSTSQEVLGRTARTNEAISELAKSQIEAAAKNTQANVQRAESSFTAAGRGKSKK